MKPEKEMEHFETPAAIPDEWFSWKEKDKEKWRKCPVHPYRIGRMPGGVW